MLPIKYVCLRSSNACTAEDLEGEFHAHDTGKTNYLLKILKDWRRRLEIGSLNVIRGISGGNLHYATKTKKSSRLITLFTKNQRNEKADIRKMYPTAQKQFERE